ncbi:hypothetical protein ciss_07720 [Carboxydothermus islandicus]|uniref:DUF2791 domain-containing protein n=1 Tax=Carboxydothermus islandicus TaxID=661089 RepID=A0A1L8D126_9THEO|nr:BREX system ATP-binding domain-containing protein [Carboxydothermus islandicus]GAV24839.1 hypothetical protein ciss_07720 [Carboxydothermus islandicus]
MSELPQIDKRLAKNIIHIVGSTGTPPEIGCSYFSVGLDSILDAFDKYYFKDLILNGQSTFKLIIANYGYGKTHFLYSIRDLAFDNNYAASYVSLNNNETPFHKLELVYKAIVNNLMDPENKKPENVFNIEKGIEYFLRRWIIKKKEELIQAGLSNDEINKEILNHLNSIKGVENTSFKNAIVNALNALLREDENEFDIIISWIKGEGFFPSVHKKYGILHKIDKSTVFPMIRSLLGIIRQLDYNGLVILFDEGERFSTLGSRAKKEVAHNLRQLVDQCGQSNFKHCLILYANTDENFLTQPDYDYEALKQRLNSYFTEFNPLGTKLNLLHINNSNEELLFQIGLKLANIFEIAEDFTFNETELKTSIKLLVDETMNWQFNEEGLKRFFVKKLIHCLKFIKTYGKYPTEEEIKKIANGEM